MRDIGRNYEEIAKFERKFLNICTDVNYFFKNSFFARSFLKCWNTTSASFLQNLSILKNVFPHITMCRHLKPKIFCYFSQVGVLCSFSAGII